jgi:hypothetical protein
MKQAKITKKKVLITLDNEIVKILKRSNKKVSTHINEILSRYLLKEISANYVGEKNHLGETDNRMVPSSNLGQVIFNETRDRGLETSFCSDIANSRDSNQ